MPPYRTRGLPPPPPVSMRTVPMAGLLVDVYGLDELPATADESDGHDLSTLPVTCLWLLHPRLQTRSRMQDFASRAVSAWNDDDKPGGEDRGLIALAFDMPNHGTRLVDARANEAWDGGNESHAVDMLGVVAAARADVATLMDVAAAHLGLGAVDGHVCLGWSLGGHAAWQVWLAEERMDAVVVIVGCPDLMGLMTHRARLPPLSLPSVLSTRYLPASLVRACAAHDPRAHLFGTTGEVPARLSAAERGRVRALLDARGAGAKRVLVCAGAEDGLVPPAVGEATVAAVREAVAEGDGGVEYRVYDGVGHVFDKEMVGDAVRFVVGAVGRASREGRRARM